MKNLNVKNNDCHAALAMTKSVQSGRSMIEMLGVLAIIGVLSVGGIAGYSKAMQKYRINKTIEQITLIAGNVRTFFAPQKSYDGVGDKTILRKAKLVPDEMWEYKDDGTFKQFTNVFGGSVTVNDVRPIVGIRQIDPIYFEIYYSIPLDYDVCIELMSHDWTAAGVKGIVLMGPMNYSAMMPISIETAVDKCSSWIKGFQKNYPSSGMGPMRFYFDLKNNCTFNGPTVVCS